MNDKFLNIIACPVCYKSLYFLKKEWKLICKFDSLSFEINNGIPILLKNSSKKILHR